MKTRKENYILSDNEKKLIMFLFWNMLDNTDKQLGDLLGIPMRVVGNYITLQLNEKFDKLNKRV
jgi:hypothetical protein